MALSTDILQHYEVLRSRFLADEHERVFSNRELSIDILISQGLIGWSKVWDRCEQNNHNDSLAPEQPAESDSEASVLCERAPEITRILVNMTLQHLNNSTTT